MTESKDDQTGGILTVFGLIDPDDLGHCQPHEHLYLDATPASLHNPLLRLDRFDLSASDLRSYQQAGGRSVVDAQPVGAGRNVLMLIQLADLVPIHIIGSTGFHVPMFYDQSHWIHFTSEDRMTALFIDEIENGMYADGNENWPEIQTNSRAGIVKAAVGPNGIDDKTRRLLNAAGIAAQKTGSALMLHSEKTEDGMLAIEILQKIGFSPERMIICHADRQLDLKRHTEIAQAGVFLEYDTIRRPRYHDDKDEIYLIRQMIEKGFLDQLLLSLDTTAGRFRSYGGFIGLDYLLTEFIPALLENGLTAEQCVKMTCVNPANALKIVQHP